MSVPVDKRDTAHFYAVFASWLTCLGSLASRAFFYGEGNASRSGLAVVLVGWMGFGLPLAGLIQGNRI